MTRRVFGYFLGAGALSFPGSGLFRAPIALNGGVSTSDRLQMVSAQTRKSRIYEQPLLTLKLVKASDSALFLNEDLNISVDTLEIQCDVNAPGCSVSILARIINVDGPWTLSVRGARIEPSPQRQGQNDLNNGLPGGNGLPGQSGGSVVIRAGSISNILRIDADGGPGQAGQQGAGGRQPTLAPPPAPDAHGKSDEGKYTVPGSTGSPGFAGGDGGPGGAGGPGGNGGNVQWLIESSGPSEASLIANTSVNAGPSGAPGPAGSPAGGGAGGLGGLNVHCTTKTEAG